MAEEQTTINTGGDQSPAGVADTSLATQEPAFVDTPAPARQAWKADNIGDSSLQALLSSKGLDSEEELPDAGGTPVVDDVDEDAIDEAGGVTAPVDGKPQPPPARFKEVIEQKNAAEAARAELEAKLATIEADAAEKAARLAEIEAKNAETQRELQMRQQLEAKAQQIGAKSVDEYRQWEQYAQTIGLKTAEDAVEYVSLQTQLENMQSLTEQDRAERLESKRQQIEVRRELAEAQRVRTDNAIEAFKSEFSGFIAPELQQQFSLQGITPQIVTETAKLFKAQVAPQLAAKDAEIARLTAIIETAKQNAPEVIKAREQNAVATAAVHRDNATRHPQPEGSGGTTPPPGAIPSQGWRANINRPLPELMAAGQARK
jgi:hypothetical protein